MKHQLSWPRPPEAGAPGGGGEAWLSRTDIPGAGSGDAPEAGAEPCGGAGGPGLKAQVVAALETQAGRVPEWVRLLPLGEVPLGDGREPLWVDEEALAAILTHFRERGLDLVVDYEHQTLSGRKAPAAGWIRELEIRSAGGTPEPEDGLWARVEWTATAREHLRAREYRYFSPVLRLEEGTRRPLALLHAALTNTPAINGLAPLVAKVGSQQAAKSGCQVSVVSGPQGGAFLEPESQITRPEAFSRQREERAAGDGGLAGGPGDGMEPLGEVALLLGLPADAGLSRVRGAVLALKGNLEHLQGVQEKLAALQRELTDRVVREEVEAALANGKIQPCQKDSALRYATQDLEGFRSFVANALPQAPLGRLSLGPDPGEDRGDGRGLTPQQLFICESLGLAPEAFKAREAFLKQEKLM